MSHAVLNYKVLKHSSLLICNSDLNGHSVFLFAEFGNPILTTFVLNKCETVIGEKRFYTYMRRLGITKF